MPERRHPARFFLAGELFLDPPRLVPDPGRWIDRSTLLAIIKALEKPVDKNSTNGADQLD